MPANLIAFNFDSGARTTIAEGLDASMLSVQRLKRGPYDQRVVRYRSYDWADPSVLLVESLTPGRFTSPRHPEAAFHSPAIEGA